ncbi:MAG TPA: SDR family oxidoreductase, partial [Nitrososphaeraceae archaeon]|nr:SDR family oxidoreductase [Nitrososphaeraceae archaeon]
MNQSQEQTKKIAVVTGSSSGIGFETSLLLARNDYYTYATMRNIDKSHKIKDIVTQDNLPLEVLQLDVNDEKSVKDAFAKIVTDKQRVDVLINNAGYDVMGPVEELSLDDFKLQFETNFFGLIRVTKEVIPIMRNQNKGTIVNVSSIGGRIGFPLNSAYQSSKFALEGLSESMRYEVEEFGINIILVEPGVIKTNFFENIKVNENSVKETSPYAPLMEKGYEGWKPMLESNSSSSPLDV